jgi:hypothetical protein
VLYIVVGEEELDKFPFIIGFKSTTIKFVTTKVEIEKCQNKSLFRLIERSSKERIIQILDTNDPEFAIANKETEYLGTIDSSDSIASAAYYLKSTGHNVNVYYEADYPLMSFLYTSYQIETFPIEKLIELENSFRKQHDSFSFKEQLSMYTKYSIEYFSSSFKNIQSKKDLDISIENELVAKEQKDIVSLLMGVLLSIILSTSLYFLFKNIGFVITKFNIWGTIILVCTLGILIFILREKNRLLYGLTEFIVGVFSIINVFVDKDFDLTKVNYTKNFTMQVIAGLYIMVRGQDNIVKALKNSKVGIWLARKGIGL